jgi:hypothetical protein
MNPRPVKGRGPLFELRRPSDSPQAQSGRGPQVGPSVYDALGVHHSQRVVADDETHYAVIRLSLEARSFAGRLAQGANTRSLRPGKERQPWL